VKWVNLGFLVFGVFFTASPVLGLVVSREAGRTFRVFQWAFAATGVTILLVWAAFNLAGSWEQPSQACLGGVIGAGLASMWLWRRAVREVEASA
jgi:hypothetical protein